VLEAAGKTTALAIMRGGVKQAIRNHLASLVFGLAPVRNMAANVVTELSIGYPKSPLNVRGSHVEKNPAPGERAPIRDGERPVGAGDVPKFAMFGEAGGATQQLLEKYPTLLDSDVRPPFHQGGFWLVRPDGYVTIATRREDWNEVDTFLGRLVAV
jgi:hypothetical protein